MIRPLRAIVLEAELDASPADVWRALTDAQALADWFPRKATAAQGVGGIVELAWDDATVWPTTIQVWEPERHLRWVDAMPPGPDGQRQAPMFVDWYISSESSQTVLRLVHVERGVRERNAPRDAEPPATGGSVTLTLGRARGDGALGVPRGGVALDVRPGRCNGERAAARRAGRDASPVSRPPRTIRRQHRGRA